MGGNHDEPMAQREVVASEAAFFRAEDDGDPAAAGELVLKDRREAGQRKHGLFGFPSRRRRRAKDKRAAGDSLGKALRAAGFLEEFLGANGRFTFAPVRLVGGDDGEPREAEVGHGPRRSTYIKRVSRRDQDELDAIELRFSEQEVIVERERAGCYTAKTHRRSSGRMTLGREALESEMERLCATARLCYGRGWVPATSGNFSVRVLDGRSQRMFITPSGLDKGMVTPAHLLEIDDKGQVLKGSGKPSAEMGLHLVVYRARPEAGAIAHVHTVWDTLLSGHYAGKDHVAIEGYEILKGLSGVTAHTHVERIPLIENTQEYFVLSSQLESVLEKNPETHGVLLNRHGLYTWGQSMAEARRHLEALEFLFEVEGRRLMGGI